MYELFIIKSLKLLKPNSPLTFIIPSTFLTNLYTRKLRQNILEKYTLSEISSFKMDVFDDPTVHTCIIKICNKKSSDNIFVQTKNKIDSENELTTGKFKDIEISTFLKNENYTFDINWSNTDIKILEKIEKNSTTLGSCCFIRQCIKTGNDDIYVQKSDSLMPFPWKKTLRGKTINRYTVLEHNEYLKYGNWLARNWANTDFYEREKIAIRETGNRIIATLDTDNAYFLSSLYAIYTKNDYSNLELRYILTILNSSLANFFLAKVAFDNTQGAFTKFRTNQLARLPFKVLTQKQQSPFIALADKMLVTNEKIETLRAAFIAHLQEIFEEKMALNKKINDWHSNTWQELIAELRKQKHTFLPKQATATQTEYERVQALIKGYQTILRRTDAEIDQKVYALYNLTPEEIEMVERG